MARKKTRKKVFSRKTRSAKGQPLYFSAITIAITALALIILGKYLAKPTNQSSLLGASTYLAKGGDDSGESESGSSGSDSGSSGQSYTSSGSSDRSNSDSSNTSGSNSVSSNSSSNPSTDTQSGSESDSNNSDSTDNTTTNTRDFTTVKTREVDPTTGIVTRTEEKENESRTEIKLNEDQKIRTRIREDGRVRTDIYTGTQKIRYEVRDGILRVIVENQLGERENEQEAEGAEIENVLENENIIVASSAGNTLAFGSNRIGARTHFPITVDPSTNQITITTPAGVRNVAILPQTAINNLLSQGIIDQVDVNKEAPEVEFDEFVEVEEEKGQPAFVIRGISSQRFLGIIPISLRRNVLVDTTTGGIQSINESLINRIVDLLSF